MKFRKRVKKFLRRYVNGTKGMVSLFLVLIISPLLSVSLLLVESARYQSAVEMMDEIVDLTGFSALADYDSYLDERFGLLAVSQESDVNAEFVELLETNTAALGQSVTINESSADGAYALSDTAVLKQQILEYSEIMVAAESVYEGLDLEALVEKLDAILGIDKTMEKILGLANDMTDLVSEAADLVEDVQDLRDAYDDYDEVLTAYEDSYTTFKSKYDALKKVLKSAKTAEAEAEAAYQEENDTTATYYSGSNSSYTSKIRTALNNYSAAAEDYEDNANALGEAVVSFSKKVDAVISDVETISAKLYSIDTGTDSTDAQISTESMSEMVESVVEQLMDWAGKIGADSMVTAALNDQDELEAQADALSALQTTITTQKNKLTKKGGYRVSSIDNAITWSTSYNKISLTAVSSSFASITEGTLSNLDSFADMDSTASDNLTALLNMCEELLGLSLLYDSNLDSAVSSSYSNMNWSNSLGVDAFTSVISSGKDLIDGLTSLNIIKALRAVATFLKAFAEFITAIVAWIAEMCVNITSFVSSGAAEWYNTLLLYGYATYNLPNRSNYSSGSTLAGYSYSKITSLAGGTGTATSTGGSLTDYTFGGSTGGSDNMFKGAEMEYILVGSASEYQNQAGAFFNLFLLRLMLDISGILTNSEVSAAAAAFNVASWVYYLAVFIAEPLLESVVLVNGGDACLFNDTVYCTPTGVVILINDLAEVTSLASSVQSNITSAISNAARKEKMTAAETADDSGLLDVSYTEHLLLLMMLTVGQDTYMTRMQNIITMEGMQKYDGDFSLDETYTYLKLDVDYTLNSLFKLDSLTSTGLFTANNTQYIGY